MKILIIGSEGFVGSHLVQYFRTKQYLVSACGRSKNLKDSNYFDVTDVTFTWKKLFAENKFDFCINAAGKGNVNISFTNPLDDFNANTSLTIEILEAIRKGNPECKYLHISSAAVYGNPEHFPILENELLKPISPYGWHKLMGEQLCHEYSSVYGLKIVVVRPFSVYGPGLRKQIFWDVFQKYKTDPHKIELGGTGEETRDFIYIDDLLNAFDILLNSASISCEVFNIGCGVEYTMQYGVSQLFESFEIKPDIIFNNQSRSGNPLKWCADISKIKKLGFNPTISFQEGIIHLADWLKEISANS